MDPQTGSLGDPYFERVVRVVDKLVSPANTSRYRRLPLHIVRDMCAFLSPDDVDKILSWYVNIIKDNFMEHHLTQYYYLEPMTNHFCQYRPNVGPWQWGPECGKRISETMYYNYSETLYENHLCSFMDDTKEDQTEVCIDCDKDCCTNPHHDYSEFRNRSCSCDSTN